MSKANLLKRERGEFSENFYLKKKNVTEVLEQPLCQHQCSIAGNSNADQKKYFTKTIL